MIPLPLELVRGLGRLDVGAGATEITGVQIDSRRIVPGDLFVAVGGGAEFTPDALARGAAATLVPDDAFAALAALGRAVRQRTSVRVVGITGSSGKTSTKDILAALCAPHARTVANEGNYNQELGVPLTLARIEPDTEICICEMGMRGLGQIAYLAGIARPDVGVITNVGPAHLELVGSLENVARAKAELVEALPPGGVAVVPRDAMLEPFLTRADITIVRFGPVGEPGVFGVGNRSVRVTSNLTAPYHQLNLLAALLAADALGLPIEDGEIEVELSGLRGQETALPGGGVLIDDTYNANPASLRAALEHLIARAAGARTVAVIGEMAELGPDAPRYHREVGEGGPRSRRRPRRLGRRRARAGVRGRRARRLGRRRGVARPRRARARGRGAREGVAGGRSRSARGGARPSWSRRLVVRVLLAVIVAMVISIVVGPKFIEFLRARELGQHIREEGPAGPRGEAGHARDGWRADPHRRLDRLPRAEPLHHGRADGLLRHGRVRRDRLRRRRHQADAPALAGALRALEADPARPRHRARRDAGEERGLTTDVYVPVLDVNLPLDYLWYGLVFFVIAGAANGVNLTDGIDGLAAGTTIIAIFAITAMNALAFTRAGQFEGTGRGQSRHGHPRRRADRRRDRLLWYNAFPAEVFMGDTGAMALGGALGAFVIMMKVELLLLLIGGIFLIEALSVMIQVFSFKYLGRRVFLIAPIHHHFAMKAWSETKIMVRFWIVTGILCAGGFGLYYLYFLDFPLSPQPR